MLKYPKYLTNHIKKFTRKNTTDITLNLQSLIGNELLEIYYYGELKTVTTPDNIDSKMILDTNVAPCKIIAKDIETDKNFLLFDNATCGFKNMFEYHYEDQKVLDNRILERYPIPASKLFIRLRYDYNFDANKSFFVKDDEQNVALITNEYMPWNEVKRNAFTSFELFYIDCLHHQIKIAEF